MKKKKIIFIGLCGQSVFLDVDHFHVPGETVHAERIFTEPGGKGYNQAVAAQRLGAQSVFIGCVGEDADGRMCEDFLKNEGIIPMMQYEKKSNTAYACILTDSAGENRVTVYRGASDCLSAEFINGCANEITSADMLVIGFECPMDATLRAAQIAFDNKVPVILNPAPARSIDIEFLKKCYLITPNRQEAAELFGLSDDISVCELAKAVIGAGMSRAVITLGGDGALLIENGEALLYPALPVKAVDTTGAGDTFNGAVAKAIACGDDLTTAVSYAMNAAALSVSHAHVMESLPTEEELLDRMIVCTPKKLF